MSEDKHTGLTWVDAGLLSKLRFGLGLVPLVLGGAALLSWILAQPALRRILPEGSEMKPNTAICLVLLSVGFLQREVRAKSKSWRVVSATAAAVAAVIAVLTVTQYWFSVNLGIDELLFEDVPNPVGTSHPGRMSQPTAWEFIAAAWGIVLLGWKRPGTWRLTQWLALGVAFLPLDIILCYIYGNMNVLAFGKHSSFMALPTAIALLSLALGLLLHEPQVGFVRILTARTRASGRFRSVLLSLIVAPPIVGWFVLTVLGGERQPPAFGVSLTVMLCMTVLAALIWINADSANRAEELLSREVEHEKTAALASDRLAAVVESSDDAIITKDLNGIVTSWNKGAQRIFGYTPKEMIGQPIAKLIPQDRQDEEPEILSRLRQGQPIEHYETIRQRKDGTLLDISLTVSPLRNADGKVFGASKIARDITEQKQARVALARSHEELEKRVAERTASLTEAIAQMEEFSYSISHDLRAPVRAMQGYAQATLEDYGNLLDEHGREYLNHIVRSGERMDRLVRELLVYSRIARSQLELRPVSLDKLVCEIVSHYPEMQQPRAEITTRGTLHSVIAHEPSLTQAISNLLNNAVKFVAPGVKPDVELYSERQGSRLRLWVHDNGIGIKPEYRARLFGLFERIHNGKQYEGTGIGLAIVRKSVERMGGKVGMESNGKGSKFWIELPSAEADS